jgi:hypothetical protein
LSVATGVVGILLVTGMSGSALAKGGVCRDGSMPPCKPGTTGGETAGNNLSFPLILSDNTAPAGYPEDAEWRFATIESTSECVDENGVVPGAPVPIDKLCYYGRHVSVSSEEGDVGEIVFDGPTKMWWLQKRTDNFWKALSVPHTIATPLAVTAVDIGDLLESTPSIQPRQIRVEFNLLQNVPANDPELGKYLVTDWSSGGVPAPCKVPTEANTSINCFAAIGMSGAVPGTEQSGNETQGADFGSGGAGWNAGTQRLIDPTTVRSAMKVDGVPIPIHALVYSHCARLLIQKIDGEPSWNKSAGQWAGNGVSAPLVNVAAYAGDWTVEITSSGSIVYGYNWNAKSADPGMYRLTMVLDGNDGQGPVCGATLSTNFTCDTALVNQGEANTSARILFTGDSALGDEGGLAYIDVELTTDGGSEGGDGGGKGKSPTATGAGGHGSGGSGGKGSGGSGGKGSGGSATGAGAGGANKPANESADSHKGEHQE